MISFSSCGNSEHSKAQERYDRAQQLFQSGDWDDALKVLAEIDSLYPGQIEIRRMVTHLRPQIIEKQTLQQLTETDSLLALATWQGDSMGAQVRRVSNLIEGYFVSKNAPADINSSPGIYSRLAPDATFYIIAVSPGVKANCIRLSVDGESITAPKLPYDGERCAAYGKNYVMTYMHGEIDDLAKMVLQHKGSPMTVEFLNDGVSAGHVNLSAQQGRDVAELYEIVNNVTNVKLLAIRKAKLEKQLELSRSQIARTTIDSVSPNR